MYKLPVRMVLVAVGCIGLAAGCGSDDEKKDGAAPKDTAADKATPKDGGVDSVAPGSDGGGGDVAKDGVLGDGPVADVPGSDARPDGGGSDAVVVLNNQQKRGQYIVDVVAVCGDCHTPRLATGAPDMTKYLSGVDCFVALPGGDGGQICLNSRNLTSDMTGLFSRSDDDVKKMFMDGLRPAPTGAVPLNPIMPYYVFHNMRPEDADAVVAYLRTVPAVKHEVMRSAPFFDVAMPATPLDSNKIPLPVAGFTELESALRGRYLATQAGVCIECHTPHNDFKATSTILDSAKFFQGGERFDFGFPVVPVSKNLTSDPTTGLGNWSPNDIIKVLKEGLDRDGKGICPPMPVGPNGPFGHLTQGDLTDIANYIKSLPPIVNQIVDMCTFPFPPPPDAGTDAAAPDAPAADATPDTTVDTAPDGTTD